MLCLRSEKAGRRRRGKKLGGGRGGGGEGERTTMTGYVFFIIIVINIPMLTLTRLIAVVHDNLSVSNFPHRDFEQRVCVWTIGSARVHNTILLVIVLYNAATVNALSNCFSSFVLPARTDNSSSRRRRRSGFTDLRISGNIPNRKKEVRNLRNSVMSE